ncbi:TGF-beta-activated kinase 1 and MAP3K7-binding protein 1-like [Eupeodes corollae]|uniref:TGF-beta-activated kinase 1 and MAP3K7-binding protein 1-like n=1 Tax=Eupeodes corollae TaxID=290404 RepID=UPI00248F6413|nr:TGF-beta-activated kinase 1 and MAP3K7-binding protein 1-like [Eupeodes corollae]
MKADCIDEVSRSWTDDLPKCKNTGAGTAKRAPQWGGGGGVGNEGHSSRIKRISDCSFYCEVNENTSLYAIFSGHKGQKVAKMAMQRIAAEIILGQLIDKRTDEEVHDVLRQAFQTVEKSYQESIDGLLAKYAVLRCQIADNVGIYEEIVRNLESIEQELAIGASAAICLIYNSRLFICNVGTCRVLLCRTDANHTSRAIQFSVDHNLLNEDEILRLTQLGVDVSQLKRFDMFNTRSIGYYLGKGGYKDCHYLANASAEPITAQPEIVGGITIDPSFQFLLLMSSGTCKYLQEIYAGDTTQENRQIVQMCARELQANHEDLTDVAQAVVNSIVQQHRETCENGGRRSNDDLTILLRNFNTKRTNRVMFNSLVQEIRNDLTNCSVETSGSMYEPSEIGTNMTETGSITSQTSCSSHFGEVQRVTPYVDFSQYYENVRVARQKGTLPEGINFD